MLAVMFCVEKHRYVAVARLLLSLLGGVTVVLVGRMHPVIVELPPLLGALSAPLILL